ncbi:MAG: phage terminase small subunit P27 family [Pseudomonadota bacterium]
MPRGRRPQPEAVREAKGNPGKRKSAAPPADTGDDIGGLGVPENLDEREARVWRTLVPALVQLRFVKRTDWPALERYCHWTVRFWDAREKIKANDAVYVTSSPHIDHMLRQNPWFGILVRAEKMLQDLEDRIGLNPTARQRILMQRAAGPTGELPLGDQPPKEAPKPAQSPIGMLSGGGSVH